MSHPKIALVFWFYLLTLGFQVLQQNHPNIVQFYESGRLEINKKTAYFAVFEPLGKDLLTLISESVKIGGFSISIIKRIAIDVLSALKTLHGVSKVVHTDIKPNNIAVTCSQESIFHQLEDIVKSRKSLTPLRMSCQKASDFFEKKTRQKLKECMEEFALSQCEMATPLNFKLIDLGCAMVGIHEALMTYIQTYFRKKADAELAAQMATSHLNHLLVYL